jgi:hypothetical protein
VHLESTIGALASEHSSFQQNKFVKLCRCVLTPTILFFSLSVYKDELETIPNYTPVAVFIMSLSMEDLLIRGPFQTKRLAGIKSDIIKVNWSIIPCLQNRSRSTQN